MKRLSTSLVLTTALLVGIEARGANPPGALDLPPSNVISAPVDITPGAPMRVERSEPSGNPLWAVPLSALTATRERPLFLPSRRAPSPAVAGTPVIAAPPPQPPVEEQPPLTLVGAIASETEGFAVFLDHATNNVVRLRTGQDHSGWVLQSVKGREVIMQKAGRSATMVLPQPGTAVGASGGIPVAAPGQGPGGKEPEL
ncbi:MAG: general secretion pathway protein GspN [Alphaproteobacteria bacterium]|nr:MAG: general secretion pathway protein GspN [Alphaproteobacteria bacterium]